MSGKKLQFHTLALDVKKDITLTLQDKRRQPILVGTLGQSFLTSNLTSKQDRDVLNLEFKGLAQLIIKHYEPEPGSHRYDFRWTCFKGKELVDGFTMKGSNWYGVGQIRKQTWPIEKWQRSPTPFVCGDSFQDSDLGGVQERYWLNSKGSAIFVEQDVPLFVSMNHKNDGKIMLGTRWSSPYRNPQKRNLYLNYTILQHENVKLAHSLAINSLIGKPTDIPDELMFRYPVWSTWAKYKKDINQGIILQFANEVLTNGFKVAQIEIDDDWTPSYGDFDFQKKKFPDPKSMVDALHDKGCRVTAWVHPFASSTSSASSKPFWLKGKLKGTITWWNGLGKCLDVTDPAAVAWYKGCMKYLQQTYGIDSFKFDAGETNWLPSNFTSKVLLNNPNEYTSRYAELCASIDTDLRAQEVRVGCRTQYLPIWVRMMDKDSNWTVDNGLKSLIPHMLTFSVIGYSFCLPDMIGGNAYKGMPDKELYIRWLEANALMPALQFSILPWQYDAEVVQIAKKMCDIHEKWGDTFVHLARECVETGAPIIRPLWWVAPLDRNAHTIDSQYMVGDDLLVAPILDKGATTRSIYLPPGEWIDQITEKELSGGRWYYGYPAGIGDLPHFARAPPPPEPEPEPVPEVDVDVDADGDGDADAAGVEAQGEGGDDDADAAAAEAEGEPEEGELDPEAEEMSRAELVRRLEHLFPTAEEQQEGEEGDDEELSRAELLRRVEHLMPAAEGEPALEELSQDELIKRVEHLLPTEEGEPGLDELSHAELLKRVEHLMPAAEDQ